ncbi:hypothetical protein MPNT_620004 [Candidatus Methylacidithermus pantelleriae]|uniref:Uncharacterized protein n=1 Tax=Candidatus Methylacidithermus pantelleriae TaxID=2744239 RepID=A0A8J2BN45_9BACT|nr:hypothetical protein MPNT_620004 [Candidatus Methylacidithermus pantelleriae]
MCEEVLNVSSRHVYPGPPCRSRREDVPGSGGSAVLPGEEKVKTRN